MKAFVLMRMAGGVPDLPEQAQGLVNYVLCDKLPGINWGAYLIAAKPAVLVALDALPYVIGIVAVTEDGDVRWGELDNPVNSNTRDRLNAYLDSQGWPTIPADWTNRQVVRAIYERANARFTLDSFNIMDVA